MGQGQGGSHFHPYSSFQCNCAGSASLPTNPHVHQHVTQQAGWLTVRGSMGNSTCSCSLNSSRLTPRLSWSLRACIWAAACSAASSSSAAAAEAGRQAWGRRRSREDDRWHSGWAPARAVRAEQSSPQLACWLACWLAGLLAGRLAGQAPSSSTLSCSRTHQHAPLSLAAPAPAPAPAPPRPSAVPGAWPEHPAACAARLHCCRASNRGTRRSWHRQRRNSWAPTDCNGSALNCNAEPHTHAGNHTWRQLHSQHALHVSIPTHSGGFSTSFFIPFK